MLHRSGGRRRLRNAHAKNFSSVRTQPAILVLAGKNRRDARAASNGRKFGWSGARRCARGSCGQRPKVPAVRIPCTQLALARTAHARQRSACSCPSLLAARARLPTGSYAPGSPPAGHLRVHAWGDARAPCRPPTRDRRQRRPVGQGGRVWAAFFLFGPIMNQKPFGAQNPDRRPACALYSSPSQTSLSH